jgi:surface protein
MKYLIISTSLLLCLIAGSIRFNFFYAFNRNTQNLFLKQNNLEILFKNSMNSFLYFINPDSLFFIQEGTVKCPNAKPGQKGKINGKEFIAVDRDLLIQKKDAGADLTCLCTSLVTDMSKLFLRKNISKELPDPINGFNESLSNWDLSNVTNVSEMFKNTLFNQPINNWDVSKVTDMSSMFENSKFNRPIDNWDTRNVKTFNSMFMNSNFNQDLSKWDVGNAEDMTAMFSNSSFNQPIESWNVSNVTKMDAMFNRSIFNKSINRGDYLESYN